VLAEKFGDRGVPICSVLVGRFRWKRLIEIYIYLALTAVVPPPSNVTTNSHAVEIIPWQSGVS
jgi:hypothetical protein